MAKVYFKTGVMGSAKTATALMTAYQYEEAKFPVLCMSPMIDDRDGIVQKGGFKMGKWTSRIGLEREIFKIDDTVALQKFIQHIEQMTSTRYKVIMIDEAQFLSTKQVEELFKIAIYTDIPVICYGLLTDFKTNLFEGSKRLIELGAKLEVIKSMGSNGENLAINGLFIDGKLQTEGETINTGGDEKYKAMTIKQYFNHIKKNKLV